MNPHLKVKTIICRYATQSGERLPLLINPTSAVPLFWPSLYTMSRARFSKKGKAANTLKRRLIAIMFLYTWAQVKGIDIEQRFRKASWLNSDEVLNLCAAFEMRYGHYCEKHRSTIRRAALMADPFERIVNKQNVIPFKSTKVRTDPASLPALKVNLEYATDYLDWLSDYWWKRLQNKPEYRQDAARLFNERLEMINELKGHVPDLPDIPMEHRVEGLAPEIQDRLLSIVHPDSDDNPWRCKSKMARVRRRKYFERIRNQLFVHMLLQLGVRRGELMNLELFDIDTDIEGEATVFIRRSPDNERDERPDGPETKTNDRLLAVNEPLAQLIDKYRENVRPKIKGSDANTFLFVSTLDGRPLSNSTATQIFETIRNRHPDLSERLIHPHILRHTWNDNWWNFCERHRDEFPPEIEIFYRTRLLGHKSQETALKYYLNRSMRIKTEAASRAYQDELMEKLKAVRAKPPEEKRERQVATAMQDTIYERAHTVLSSTILPRPSDEYDDVPW